MQPQLRVYKSESMPFMASRSVMLSSMTPAKVRPFLTVDQVLVSTSLSARGTFAPVEAVNAMRVMPRLSPTYVEGTA